MKAEPKFAVCINNNDYPASLEFGKIYRVLPDEKAERHKMVRVVDESEDDYLYSESYFVVIELPQVAEDALLASSLKG